MGSSMLFYNAAYVNRLRAIVNLHLLLLTNI